MRSSAASEPVRRLSRFALLVLLPALFWLSAGSAGEPLRGEQVVRLFVSGTPVGELIRLIRESEVDFDLSPEMVQELRAAGLPDNVLTAMRERQAELERRDAPPADAVEAVADGDDPAASEGPRLVVRLNPDWVAGAEGGRPTLRVQDAVSPQASSALGLREEGQSITDMAIVLACRTADHVPDHWRAQTPLGRDFKFTPRHRLLAFLPGASLAELSKTRKVADRVVALVGGGESQPAANVLELEIPATIGVTLEPAVAHDLTLGIALQVGGRYYLVASTERDAATLDAEAGLELRAELSDAPDLAISSLTARFLE
jgi:hypothetical protein